MYTFTQLLLRNSILALIFITGISAVSLSMLSSLLDNKAQQHSQIINLLTKDYVTANGEVEIAQNIVKALKKATPYDVIIIYNHTNETLISYKDADIGFSLPFISPKPKKYIAEQLDVTVEYQLNFSSEYDLVLSFILLSSVLSCLLVILAATMSTKRHKAIFNMINQQIKNDLSLINHNNTSQREQSDGVSDLLEIPELKQGISDIKELMTKQLENTINLEQEAYVDHLTKLDNRNRFVKFYENQVVQKSPVQFGVLIITRCSELQTINQIHGYKEGDNYIAHVAKLIKQALSTYSDGNAFRLNSSDFASILPNTELKEAEKFTKELTLLFNNNKQDTDKDFIH